VATLSWEVPPLVLQEVPLQQFFKSQRNAGRKLNKGLELGGAGPGGAGGRGLGRSNPCTVRHKWEWEWEWAIINHISLLTKAEEGGSFLRARRPTVGR